MKSAFLGILASNSLLLDRVDFDDWLSGSWPISQIPIEICSQSFLSVGIVYGEYRGAMGSG